MEKRIPGLAEVALSFFFVGLSVFFSVIGIMDGIDDFIHRRNFIPLQLGFDAYRQGVFVDGVGILGYAQQFLCLADDRMLCSDADAVLDPGIGGCDALDLDGIDLIAAYVDHVSGASGEMKHTILVEITEV